MDTAEYAREKSYLDAVLSRIARRLEQLRAKQTDDRDGVVRARREMWDDAAHLVRDMDDLIEMSEYDADVKGVTDEYLRNADEVSRLERMLNSPYFGRFDMLERGAAEPEAVYVGPHSLMDESTYEMYVYDWRAPVCSAFYDFDLGDASYETPNGLRPVRIVLKRQYKIEAGRLLSVYDTDSPMHDEILGSILSQNTGPRLKVIIGSIQKEQNAAIRDMDGRWLLIAGPAGSGKTSVGLHRLAYILYHRRDTIRSGDIVALSGSAVFSSYISGILPELGESDVVRAVFSDLLTDALGDNLTTENAFSQIRALGRAGSEGRREAVGMKYARDFLVFFADYFNNFRFLVPELRYKNQVVLSLEEFQRYWDERHFSGFKASLTNLFDKLRQYYEEYFEANKKSIFKDIMDETDDILSDAVVRYRYEARLERCVKAAEDEVLALNAVSPLAQLRNVLALYSQRRNLTVPLTIALSWDENSGYLPFEDALLYFLTRVLMGEIEPRGNVKQVLIDEAQDYCLLQLLIVKLLYPKSGFTLLADVNQAVTGLTSVGRYEDFELVFGPSLKTRFLERSYRSSGPINALAFALVGKIDARFSERYTYFDRDGKKPRLMVTDRPDETVLRCLSGLSGYRMVVIVTDSEEQANGLYAALSGVLPDIRLIAGPSGAFTAGTVILPLLLAKGLEFDAVIAVGCFRESGNEALDRRRAYLACTRALHELYLVESSPLPACFADIAPFLETAC